MSFLKKVVDPIDLPMADVNKPQSVVFQIFKYHNEDFQHLPFGVKAADTDTVSLTVETHEYDGSTGRHPVPLYYLTHTRKLR